jgi:hypothetical protein
MAMKVLELFKKPKEKIDIEVPEVPQKVISKAKDEEIYFERANFVDNKYNLDDCFDQKTKQDRILECLLSYEKKSSSMFHKYYFFKLFSKAAMRDSKYNEQFIVIDKHINRIKKNYDELKKKTDYLKFVKDAGDLELEDIFTKINELFEFYRGLDADLNKFQKTYYQDLKMTSYSICNDKTYQEIEALNKSVNKMIEEYKNIQEAYDFIYYNSGELIVDTINSLVQCIENSGNKQYISMYKYDYFLESDYVVVLKFTEWIELFTKILYVLRMITSKVDSFDFLNFKSHYQELEKRYLILLIYSEMNQK